MALPRGKQLVAVAVAALAIAGVALLLYRRHERSLAEAADTARRARAAQAWADAQQCLLGAKLADLPAPAERVRRIELAGEKSAAEDGWPRRCGAHVTSLYGELDDQGFGAALREELRQRFGCAGVCSVTDPATQLAGLLDAAGAAGLALVEPSVAAPAMVTTAFLGKGDLGQLVAGDTVVRDRDHLPDGRARYLFSSRAEGLSLCDLAPDAEAGASCRGVKLPISADAAELVPGAERPLLRSKGTEPTSFDVEGEAVRVHGGKESGFSVRRVGKQKLRVTHVERGAAGAEKELELEPGAKDPFLVGDTLFWFEPDLLASRRFTLDGGKISGDRQVVGTTGARRGVPQICKNGDTTALLFGEDRKSFWLVIGDGKRWVGPIVPGEAAPLPPPKEAPQAKPGRKPGRFAMVDLIEDMNEDEEPSPWGRPKDVRPEMWSDEPIAELPRRARLARHAFNCGGGAATLTWRTPLGQQQLVSRLRCTADGCEEATATLDGLSVKEWWMAATLGGATLLVWRDEAGLLRTRHAPIGELAAAKDALVMDSVEHGGPATADLEAVIGADAVIFVFRSQGFHALRFSADGSYRPL